MNRDYFEGGCLCVLTGKLETAKPEDTNAFEYYMENCTCSRHPESSTRFCWDRDITSRKNALSLIAKRHPDLKMCESNKQYHTEQ